MPRWAEVLLTLVLFAVVMGAAGGSRTQAEEAVAHFYDGNKLYALCQNYPEAALQYVIGAMDGGWVDSKGVLSFMVCAPKNVTSIQAKDISCGYLRDNPAQRQYTAASSVYSALSIAFPCNRR